MAPRFSIVTVNYNELDGLYSTLASIAAQTCTDRHLGVAAR